MVEVPSEGSLSSFFADLEEHLEPAGSLWVVFPKKPFVAELEFPYMWLDVQKAGLAAGLVDNKIAAFCPPLPRSASSSPWRGARPERNCARAAEDGRGAR